MEMREHIVELEGVHLMSENIEQYIYIVAASFTATIWDK